MKSHQPRENKVFKMVMIEALVVLFLFFSLRNKLGFDIFDVTR